MKKDIVIIGAGITGLSLAHYLLKKNRNFVLIEKESIAGGKVKTIQKEGYTCECGPNTVQLQEASLFELLDDLRLNDSIVFANNSLSKNRFVNTKKGFRKLPSGPFSLINTNLISSADKLKILKDFFSNTSKANDNISVESYFKAKFGNSLTKNIIDPFVTGIYAGDIKKMSFKYSFPKLFKADQEYGSLIKGLIASRKNSTGNKGIFTFKNGLATLIHTLESEIRKNIKLNSEVNKIERQVNGSFKIYINSNSKDNLIEATQVIDTRPLDLVERDLNLTDIFPKSNYVPVVSLHLGFKSQSLNNVHSGFGVLNNSESGKNYLGCIFNSDIFPHTAPENHKLYTILIGGARNPEIALNFNEKKKELIIQEFISTMKIGDWPDFINYYYWPFAIPQYNIGHDKMISSINRFQSDYQNYHLMGNYKDGVSIGDCVKKAKSLSKML